MTQQDKLNLDDIRIATELRLVHRSLMQKANDKDDCLDINPCIKINKELGLDAGNMIGGLIFFYIEVNKVR